MKREVWFDIPKEGSVRAIGGTNYMCIDFGTVPPGKTMHIEEILFVTEPATTVWNDLYAFLVIDDTDVIRYVNISYMTTLGHSLSCDVEIPENRKVTLRFKTYDSVNLSYRASIKGHFKAKI